MASSTTGQFQGVELSGHGITTLQDVRLAVTGTGGTDVTASRIVLTVAIFYADLFSALLTFFYCYQI